MKDCTVSMMGDDGETHQVEVKASSLFDAVAQATRGWSLLWWYRCDGLVEVRSGDGCWKVRAEQVSRWQQSAPGHEFWR